MSIHIGNLHHDAQKQDLEREFNRYGRIRSMWIARSPPGFAFIEFEDLRDAEDAIRDMDGRELMRNRIRVQMKINKDTERGRRDDVRDRDVDNSRKPTRSEHRIICTGLADGVHWKELKDLLKEKTEPVYVDLRGEGKAVAEFATAEDVSVAIESFGGQEFKGGVLIIAKDEAGGDERSDSWQQFDTRPRAARGGGRDRDQDRGGESRGRDRGRRDSRDRNRSRSRERGYRSRSRSRSRPRRGYDDRRRSRSRSRGARDRRDDWGSRGGGGR